MPISTFRGFCKTAINKDNTRPAMEAYTDGICENGDEQNKYMDMHFFYMKGSIGSVQISCGFKDVVTIFQI